MNAKLFVRAAAVAGAGLAAYAGVFAAARPWRRRWGAIDDEIAQPLPGDELSQGSAPANHAITIDAPVEEVWPWLVQIGQDRAGFYSYSWLENLFRAHIHNADEIVPEWQTIAEGGSVRLASKDVYGDGPLLRVGHVRPGRSFVLQGWGEFVLRPVDKPAHSSWSGECSSESRSARRRRAVDCIRAPRDVEVRRHSAEPHGLHLARPWCG